MASEVQVLERRNSIGRTGVVGLRSLPQLKMQYYARTPKHNPFATVWLPVNASNRCIVDDSQDVLHLYYSRHLQSNDTGEHGNRSFNLDLDLDLSSSQRESTGEFALPPRKPSAQPDSVKSAMWMTNRNSPAPFASLGKPTCGYYFSRSTDNKKRLIGIPPTNLVKWRSQEIPSRVKQ